MGMKDPRISAFYGRIILALLALAAAAAVVDLIVEALL